MALVNKIHLNNDLVEASLVLTSWGQQRIHLGFFVFNPMFTEEMVIGVKLEELFLNYTLN